MPSNFKSVFSPLILSLASISALANDLPDDAKPRFRYEEVAIQEIRDAKLDVKYLESPNALPRFKGKLTLKLGVEGNICSSNPDTFGIFPSRRDHAVSLRLMAGADLANPEDRLCLQYGSDKNAIIDLDIDLYVIPGRKIEEMYLLPVGNDGKTASVRVYSEGGTLKVETIK